MKEQKDNSSGLEAPRHLLVIDDEAPIREVLKDYLVRHGFHVSTAATGAEAIRLANLLPADLIVLDVLLEDSNGLDLLVKFKKARPRRPVIMITGLGADEDLKRQALEKGAAECVSKALPLDQLLASIERVLAAASDASGPGQAAGVRRGQRTPKARPAISLKLPDSDHKAERTRTGTAGDAGQAGGPATISRLAKQPQAERSAHQPLPARLASEDAAQLQGTEAAEAAGQKTSQGETKAATPPSSDLRTAKAPIVDPASVAKLISVTPGAAPLEFGMEIFLRMLSAYHPNLGNTALRAVSMCKTVGETLQLAPAQLQNLLWAAALHDVSMVRIERDLVDRWMRNPDKCTREELIRIKSHPERSQRMLEFCPALKAAGEIIAAHHESWDGTGYPAGMRMEMIPWLARILSVVIYYCSKNFPGQKTVAEIEGLADQRFDPNAVHAVVKAIPSVQLPAGGREIPAQELRPGMFLAAEITNWDGVLVFGGGTELSNAAITKIVHLSQAGQIEPRVQVFC